MGKESLTENKRSNERTYPPKTASSFEEFLDLHGDKVIDIEDKMRISKKDNRNISAMSEAEFDKIPTEKKEEQEFNLQWRSTTYKNSPNNSSWAEDAINSMGIVVYRLYYETEKKMTILEDIRLGIEYNISTGAKAKGYVLAFKLNEKFLKSKNKRIKEAKDKNDLPF